MLLMFKNFTLGIFQKFQDLHPFHYVIKKPYMMLYIFFQGFYYRIEKFVHFFTQNQVNLINRL